MVERRSPAREEVCAYLDEQRHGGQRGEDDQVGTLTLLTPPKRVNTAAGGSSAPANPIVLF
jgi:hypothetical protein